MLYVERYGSKVPVIVPVMSVLMLLDSFLVLAKVYNYGLDYTKVERLQIEKLKKESPIIIKMTDNNGFLYKLQEAGVEYIFSNEGSYITTLSPEVSIQQSVKSCP